eukprot:TRINITY_DN69916_c0_g1_i1.p1 TRINITY_DN69916_c0_g1~~TRINITY_DN69916_c0_g1_i1.p1  ORF type:complete len:257 (-),score=20.58 TRINITY_DN69916_c0_g1_i1:106-876(-)
MKMCTYSVTQQERFFMRWMGLIGGLVFLLWNGAADIILGAYIKGSPDGFLATVRQVPPFEQSALIFAQTSFYIYPVLSLSMWQFYKAMEHAGPWLSVPPAALCWYCLSIGGGGLHLPWPIISALSQAERQIGRNTTDKEFLEAAQSVIEHHMAVGVIPVFVFGAAACLWFIPAILSGKTYYPKWFVLCTPLPCAIIGNISANVLLPEWPALVVGVTGGTWQFAIPLLVSTALVWNMPVSPVGAKKRQLTPTQKNQK